MDNISYPPNAYSIGKDASGYIPDIHMSAESWAGSLSLAGLGNS